MSPFLILNQIDIGYGMDTIHYLQLAEFDALFYSYEDDIVKKLLIDLETTTLHKPVLEQS